MVGVKMIRKSTLETQKLYLKSCHCRRVRTILHCDYVCILSEHTEASSWQLMSRTEAFLSSKKFIYRKAHFN